MKTRHVVALSTLTGVVLGAVAIQGLHAQAKPPTYVVVAIRSITDPEGLQSVIQKTAPQVLAEAGGHYVIRTSDISGLDGTPPKRFVLIAFDSVEKAQAWHNSPAQKEIDALRAKSTDSLSFIVEGVANEFGHPMLVNGGSDQFGRTLGHHRACDPLDRATQATLFGSAASLSPR